MCEGGCCLSLDDQTGFCTLCGSSLIVEHVLVDDLIEEDPETESDPETTGIHS